MTRSRKQAVPAALVLLALGLGTAAVAGPADARRFPEATCTFDRANATLTVVATNTRMTISRRGDEIAVAQSGTGARTCAGTPTVSNVDLIRIDASTGAMMTLDLRGGAFAPGLTAESDGSPEIEVEADLDFADLTVEGGAEANAITAGTTDTGFQALNLNADERRADRDVLFLRPRPILTIAGGAGTDTISADGGAGLDAGLRGRLAVDGGAGDDRLEGSPGPDSLKAGGGRDRVRALGGRDSIYAHDGTVDRVSCGGGADAAGADREDRLRGCERVRR